MEDVKARMANLSPEKRALLDRMLKKKGISIQQDDRIMPRRNPETARLSFGQQRLWFLEQFDPGTSLYNMGKSYRIAGKLDPEILRRSIESMCERHEILRTSFALRDGMPVQVIASRADVPFEKIDLPAELPDKQVEEMLSDLLSRPFRLPGDPLFRVYLLRRSGEDHVLALAMHHIISDAWSVTIMAREIAQFYAAYSQGVRPALAPLPVQYGDYAEWQRDRMQGEFLEREFVHWRERLSGAPPVLDLPFDHPRPAKQLGEGGQERIKLSRELNDRVRQFCRDEGVTPFMALLAVYTTLIHRFTGQADIVVGTPVAGRTRPEVEKLIGLFVNTLVLRSDFSGEPAFREVLTRTREMALDAFAHAELPFEKLVEDLQPERSLSHSPVFQLMFSLQNTPPAEISVPGLAWTPIPAQRFTSKFDLTLNMQENAGEMQVTAEYNTTLFEARTVRKLLGHYCILMESALAHPERPVGRLDIMSMQEKETLLVRWNDTSLDVPASTFPQLFEEQVRKSPRAVALRHEDQELTYAELNSRANRLARLLNGKYGVGRESVVGICLTRSLEMVVSQVAVMKAGAGYLPLDPSYPPDRLAFMIDDARVPVVIAGTRSVSSLPANASAVLVIDEEQEVIDGEDDSNLPASSGPESLAYLIYTSGSTGRPKGVQIEHRSLTNFFSAFARQLAVGSQDTFLAVTTLSFDIAGLELLLPLVLGATVHIAPREVAADGMLLRKLIDAGNATVMQATPATWKMLVAAGWEGKPASLKILCGGEALDWEVAEQLERRGVEVWNLYGPTETTIWSSAYRLGPERPDTASVLIGRPVANTCFYVLDRQGQPAPIGVPGELYIGGAGLARGYRNRPELNAEKFVADPFAKKGRMYRTGDLVRYRPDGNVEYIGRLDNQVKIRGYRVELGEIEAILNEHRAVRESVAVARSDQSGEKRLIAYVVFAAGEELSSADLRAYLAPKLPDFMIPSLFVKMQAFPLTPSGKVDRNALPEPVQERHIVPARNPIEQVLASIWMEVLGVARVGIEDNFFDLGGHSLLAMQLISRVREAFQCEIPLRTVFEAPTIELFAAALSRDDAERARLEEAALLFLEVASLNEEDVRKLLEEQ